MPIFMSVFAGVPAGLCRKIEDCCLSVVQLPRALWQQGCGGCWRFITGAQAYSLVQTSDSPLDPDALRTEAAEQGIALSRSAQRAAGGVGATVGSLPSTPSAESGIATTSKNVSSHKKTASSSPDVHYV